VDEWLTDPSLTAQALQQYGGLKPTDPWPTVNALMNNQQPTSPGMDWEKAGEWLKGLPVPLAAGIPAQPIGKALRDRFGNMLPRAAEMVQALVSPPHDAMMSGYQGNPQTTEQMVPGAFGIALGMMGKPPVPGGLGTFGGKLPSAVTRAIEGAQQPKAPGSQWLGWLRNQPNIKQEELEATGIAKYLQGKSNAPITQKELADYARANQIELKDVEKGHIKQAINPNSQYALPQVLRAAQGAGETPGDLLLTIANDGDAYRALTRRFPALANDENWAETVVNDLFGSYSRPAGVTKFSQYQIPGGTNYREMLLTMPQKAEQTAGYKVIQHPSGDGFALQDAQGNLKLAPADYRNPGEPLRWETRELAENAGKPFYNQDTANFKSSHWDEPNVLAHVRMNDRNINGKKTLFLEEIQSDWHQKGRESGYRSPEMPLKARKTVDGYWEISGGPDNRFITNVVEPNLTEAQALTEARNRLGAGSPTNLGSQAGVPDAPFKSTWPDLALKRMLHHAVENGHDQIAWTTGDMQNARYDLSKHVKRIYLNDPVFDEGGKFLRGTINAEAPGGGGILNQNVTAENLAQYIGHDAANRIVHNPTRFEGSKGGRQVHVLEGDGLKVGGQGMQDFYDKILPNAANRITKQYGGRTEQRYLKDIGKADNQPVHVLQITPALRSAILNKQIPLH
jgi:hypothetical protein